jgi:hypothetical protein
MLQRSPRTWNILRSMLYDRKQRLQKQKHTTGGIPRWSPTLVLVARFSAYVWQSGRDAQFSLTYGRMCCFSEKIPQHRFMLLPSSSGEQSDPVDRPYWYREFSKNSKFT